MHDCLKDEIELMGYKSENVQGDPNIEQDFLIMSRLMRISRSGEFSDDELAFYQSAATAVTQDEKYVVGARILTPDFAEDEFQLYQWAAEHPTGSCRGYRLTEEPTEQEVKEWQESLEYLNGLNFDVARSRVKFLDKDKTKPYEEDLHWSIQPKKKNAYEEWRSTQVGPDDHQTVAQCSLGEDPYRLLD